MTISNRPNVMKQSRELKRCICSSPAFPFSCPCKFMLDKKICHCNGESHEGFTQEQWAEYNLAK